VPRSIPTVLTREHVLRALADLDSGLDHPFGTPTGYVLVEEDKWHAPKAVVGLAFRYHVGRVLQPDEFSGGEAPGQANSVLRSTHPVNDVAGPAQEWASMRVCLQRGHPLPGRPMTGAFCRMAEPGAMTGGLSAADPPGQRQGYLCPVAEFLR
jgi:hypothetical protein